MCKFAPMTDRADEIRKYVQELRSKSGLSFSALAKAAGLQPSTVNRFMKGDAKHVLSTVTLGKLQDAAEKASGGLGMLPHLEAKLSAEEMAARNGIDLPRRPSELPPANARIGPEVDLPTRGAMRRDLPIYGTAAGSDGDGAFILNAGDVVDRAYRPPSLVGNTKAYGLYVEGDSMAPAYVHGSFVVADPTKKPRPGDNVIVVIVHGDNEHAERAAYVKEFVKQSATELHLRQHNPPAVLVFSRSRVVPESMHRLLTLAELMGVG